MKLLNITLKFDKGYIASPYWPELERLINIQKESGMKRARSSANARAALEQHIKAIGMTLSEYEALEYRAKRPFYTISPTPSPSPSPTPTPSPTIIIPEHHIYGMLVASADTIRAAGRACPPDQVRTRIHASDFVTDRTAPDGLWERFVTVTSGTGAKLSNQRALRQDYYISNFTAIGTLSIDPDFVKPDVLISMLEFAGRNVGIGASRKMGWGRFEVASCEA